MIKAFSISILTVLLSTTLALAEVDGTTSIKESVAGAVRQHPQIKSLLYNRDAMARNLSAALGRFFPSLDLTSNYGFQEYSSSTTRGDGTDDRTRTASDTTLKVTQNVFDGMSRYNTYEGSKARLSSAEYRLFNNVETIGLDAIRAHIDVVRQRRLANLAEENIVAHQEVLESIAERVAGGAGSKADEMQARGRVARAETTFVTYTGGLHTAEASYIRLVGKMPGALSDPFFHTEYIPADMNQIMETSLKDNPKIKVYQAEVLSAEKNKNVTNAAMFPTVDLEVSSRHTDNLDGAKTYLRDDRAMLAMSWNLFSGGSDYSSLQASDSRIREAESNLQDATDELAREVAVAWTEYQTAVGQIEKHQEALQYSMESRDMYLMQFNVGQRSLLDVLDSINEVFSNSVLLETAQSNLYFTQYKFLALNGELIKTLEIESKTYDSKTK